MRILNIILICFALFSSINAQCNNIQTWIDYTTNNWIDTEWLYNGDYGIRGRLTIDDWTQYYINPAFVFRKSEDLTYHGGLRSIYTYNFTNSNTFEAGPW